MAQGRRRRGKDDLSASARLAIPPEDQAEADRKGLQLRWVNDEGNRMYQLTKLDDYGPVEGVDPVPIGKDKDGQPIKAHLLAKPKAYIAEDQAVREEARKAQERAFVNDPQAMQGKGANPNPGDGKAPAAVNSPGSRSASPSNRAKGFADLPPAAQKIAKDMVERKVIPNLDAYTKMYWQNAERKA